MWKLRGVPRTLLLGTLLLLAVPAHAGTTIDDFSVGEIYVAGEARGHIFFRQEDLDSAHVWGSNRTFASGNLGVSEDFDAFAEIRGGSFVYESNVGSESLGFRYEPDPSQVLEWSSGDEDVVLSFDYLYGLDGLTMWFSMSDRSGNATSASVKLHDSAEPILFRFRASDLSKPLESIDLSDLDMISFAVDSVGVNHPRAGFQLHGIHIVPEPLVEWYLLPTVAALFAYARRRWGI